MYLEYIILILKGEAEALTQKFVGQVSSATQIVGWSREVGRSVDLRPEQEIMAIISLALPSIIMLADDAR